MDCRCWKYF